MSDNTATGTVHNNECTSCQLFLRVGIPAVVVFLMIVIAGIVWFDRYDKHRLQKKFQEKQQNKSQQRQHQHSTESNSSESVDVEPDLSIYTVTSRTTSIVEEPVKPQMGDTDLENMEHGKIIPTDRKQTNDNVVSPPAYRIQRFHALIQQVHEENLRHLPPILQDEEGDDDDEDQSSIESDATPTVTNNNNNVSSQSPMYFNESAAGTKAVIVQLPSSKDGTHHAEIGLIRNHLSISGTTESESTSSSSSSTSSSSSSYHSGEFIY